MAGDAVETLIDQQQWLEPVADKLQQAIRGAFEEAGPPGRQIQNFLHGTWLGHPLHAVLTDIPIGAWTAALILDLLDEASGDDRFATGADGALQIGLAGAVAAALAGLTDWHVIDGRPRRTGLVHGLLNLTSAGLYTTSLICRKRKDRLQGRIYAYAAYLVAFGSAYLGGKLVYSDRIGVDHTSGEHPPHDFVPVLADSDLREGELRRVTAGSARVLLTRVNGEVHAIAEVCSHLGGPLAEGKLEGDVVQCPWHGSEFSVPDGCVVNGPAVHPQPRYETRVNNGQIEVRSAAH
jgi:nitrite reductase/ring-hydroxylating ferredoxin subunit/uncharacterized membrane protein